MDAIFRELKELFDIFDECTDDSFKNKGSWSSVRAVFVCQLADVTRIIDYKSSFLLIYGSDNMFIC